MPDHIEEQLRAALSHHAAQIDPDSISRLRTIDYRPPVSVLSRLLRSLEWLAARRHRPPR
jgi:hypothetical protein